MQAMPPTNVTYQYDGPGGLNGLFSYNGADVEAKQFIHDHLRFNNDVGNHLLATKSVHTIAEGGTINGPARASVAHAVSLMKKGYGDGTAKGGEMDGIYLVVRQDQRDGVRADACGILIDAAFYDNDGFVGGIEGHTEKRQGNPGGAKPTRLSDWLHGSRCKPGNCLFRIGRLFRDKLRPEDRWAYLHRRLLFQLYIVQQRQLGCVQYQPQRRGDTEARSQRHKHGDTRWHLGEFRGVE